MKAAALPKLTNGTARILKILAVILLVACAETWIYHRFSPVSAVEQRRDAALSPRQAIAYINDTPNLVIIDVRSQKEFYGGHLQNAVNIPLYDFQNSAKNIPSGSPILLHCMFGYRSLQAYKLLRRLRPDIREIRYVAGNMVAFFLPGGDCPPGRIKKD